VRTVRRKRPRGLDAYSRGYAGNEHSFAVQIDPGQDVVCG
jgi:hypothetical protein